MGFVIGDKVQLVRASPPAKRDHGGVVIEVLDDANVMVEIRHDEHCAPLPNSIVIGPLPASIFTPCNCPD